MKNWIVYIAAIFLLLIGAGAKSDENRAQSTGHRAHTHGLAELTLAKEGNELEIQLESPAVNLFGFEHRANTEDELRAVKSAKTILESPGKVFLFEGTDCDPGESDVDVSGAMADEDAHHSAAEHSEDHDEEHEAHEEHDEHHESHSEVTASYRFTCVRGTGLEAVSVTLFEHFPGLEKVQVNWVTETRQGSTTLRANDTKFSLK